jgi:hypothetical protein
VAAYIPFMTATLGRFRRGPFVIAALVALTLVHSAGRANSSPGPAASPATTSTAAPAATDSEPTTPVRECVYKVSSLLRVDIVEESYGGGANAALPGSNASSEDDGTVTVDVMGKFQDGGLAIRLTERWRDDPVPHVFKGAVASDGTVAFPPTTINAVSRELLPYFATAFASSGPLVAGTHWTVQQTDGQLVATTDYSVTSATGGTLTIAKKQSNDAIEGVSISGSVVYDSTLLVPISGQLRKRTNEMESNGQATGTLDLRFDLVSDSFRKPASP